MRCQGYSLKLLWGRGCNDKRHPCLSNILNKQPTRAAGKKSFPKFANILNYLYLNLQQLTNKVTKNNLFQCFFLRILLTWQQCIQNISNKRQQLKSSRLQEKFCVAAFLIKNVCSKTFLFFVPIFQILGKNLQVHLIIIRG